MLLLFLRRRAGSVWFTSCPQKLPALQSPQRPRTLEPDRARRAHRCIRRHGRSHGRSCRAKSVSSAPIPFCVRLAKFATLTACRPNRGKRTVTTGSSQGSVSTSMPSVTCAADHGSCGRQATSWLAPVVRSLPRRPLSTADIDRSPYDPRRAARTR